MLPPTPSGSAGQLIAPRVTSADCVYRVETAWGSMSIEWRGDAVTRITPPHEGITLDAMPSALDPQAPTVVRDLAEALQQCFAGEAVELVTRDQVESWLDTLGISGARRAMSLALFDVPRGVTLSYGELAALAGYPGAARAAGSMCARNPLPILIPCHRVVHAGARRGDVGRYGAATGSEYKRRLLELEDAPLVRSDGRT